MTQSYDEILNRQKLGVKRLLDWCDRHWTTSSADRCARILLGTWNSSLHPINLLGIRDLNEDLRDAALDVIRGYVLTGKESHQFGDERRIEALHHKVVGERDAAA